MFIIPANAARVWLSEAPVTDVVQFLNSTKRKEDPRLAAASVSASAASVGHSHCSRGMLASECAALKLLALTEFSVGKGWEESLGRQ